MGLDCRVTAALEKPEAPSDAAVQKAREASRFAKALRFRLADRVAQLGITLPPLCACGYVF